MLGDDCFHGIAPLLADFYSNSLADFDDITDEAIAVFDTHVDDAPVVRFTVKDSVDLRSPLAKLRFYIVRKNDKCGRLSRNPFESLLQNHKFSNLFIYPNLPPILN